MPPETPQNLWNIKQENWPEMGFQQGFCELPFPQIFKKNMRERTNVRIAMFKKQF